MVATPTPVTKMISSVVIAGVTVSFVLDWSQVFHLIAARFLVLPNHKFGVTPLSAYYKKINLDANHSGVEYIWSYPGILKMTEGILNGALIIFATLLGASYQSNLLIGLSIYALISVILLLIFHIRGTVKTSEFPWFWAEFINSGMLVVLYAVTASLVIIVLTKGFIITGIMGYITVVAYTLDAMDKFHMARTPRARYVWTTPNLPEFA